MANRAAQIKITKKKKIEKETKKIGSHV